MKVTIVCSAEELPALLASLGPDTQVSIVMDKPAVPAVPAPPAVLRSTLSSSLAAECGRKVRLYPSYSAGMMPLIWLPHPAAKADWKELYPIHAETLYRVAEFIETTYDCSAIPRVCPGALKGGHMAVIENINLLQQQVEFHQFH